MKIEFFFPNKSMSYLHYNVFKVGSALNGYPLTVGGYTGIHQVDPFSTHPLNGMMLLLRTGIMTNVVEKTVHLNSVFQSL